MSHGDDLTRARLDAREAEDQSTRTVEPAAGGAPRLAAVTVAVSSYPAVAARYYGFRRVVVGGAETEGGTGTETTVGGTHYAYNLGDTVPPVGAKIVVTQVASARWVFCYGSPRTT